MSPLKDCRVTAQPDHKMLTAASTAITGSRTCQPVMIIRTKPTSSATDVVTSVRICQPSAASAGERQARPLTIKSAAQPALSAVARPL